MELDLEIPLVFELINSRNKEELASKLESWLPNELLELCKDLNAKDQSFVFAELDREQAYKTFELMDINMQIFLMDELRYRQLQLILNDMSADNRTALLEELDQDRLNNLIKLLTIKEKRVALSLLGYPEDSIGRLMTPDYIAVNQDWTVGQVINYIRKNGESSETLDVLYIVDNNGYLIDDIKLGDILLAKDDLQIHELLDGKFVWLNVTDDEEVAIKAFSNTNRVRYHYC
jgi:magnesium transporter